MRALTSKHVLLLALDSKSAALRTFFSCCLISSSSACRGAAAAMVQLKSIASRMTAVVAAVTQT
jgi:hypothetical protein